MKKQVVHLTLLSMLILSLLFLIWDYRWSIGIVVGTLTSLLNLLILTWYCTGILKDRSGGGVQFGMFSLVRIAILSIPLAIAGAFPQTMNIFTVALGLLLLRICILIDEFKVRRQEKKNDIGNSN